MVELDDGPYLVGRLVDDSEPATVGARVAAEFVDTDGVPSVQWKIG
jgi:uncharacterized OB-fold protein